MTSFSDFVKGKFDGVSLGRDGRLSLAPKLDTFFTSGQPVIWSVAAAPDGSFYAGTGHSGRVFRVEPNGSSRLVWTAERPEVFAVVVDAHGVVFAASSPGGKIYRIENGKAEEYFDPKAKYIWSLAIAPDGTLYAGTGDKGVVYRITGAGRGEVYYSTGQANVTGLLVDPQGRVLAGTEPSGVLYRITAKDKAFALYDSSLPEIRAVAPAPDGSIYAVALGGALEKKLQATQVKDNSGGAGAGAPADVTITVTADTNPDLKPTPPQPAKPQQAAPQPDTPGVSTSLVDSSSVEKSAIYRIRPDNTVETLWSSKEENVYDIVPTGGGQIFFGTDDSGRIYRLTPDHKLTLVAQTNEAQAIRLLDKGRLARGYRQYGQSVPAGSAGRARHV